MRFTWFERWKILYQRWIEKISLRALHPVDDSTAQKLKTKFLESSQ